MSEAEKAASGEISLGDKVRAAHRNYPTGVTVITTSVEGQPYGLAVNAFSSVSLDPPTLLFCVNESSKTYPHLINAHHVGINVLSGDQHEIAGVFASSGGDKFSEIAWEKGVGDIPLITGAAARFSTEIEHTHKVGTHTVFICRVVDVDLAEGEPLVYFRGGFAHGSRILAAE